MALDRAPNSPQANQSAVQAGGRPTRQTNTVLEEIWRQIVAGFVIVPCIETGTNALALTPRLHQEGAANLGDGMAWSFTAANTSTGAVTAAIGALPAKKVYTNSGALQAGAGVIAAGSKYLLIYDPALDAGSGGFVAFGSLNLSGIYQPLDATLTALSGLDASQGFIYQTGSDAFTKLGLKGYLFGMAMANGTDAVNDINFGAGVAFDSTGAAALIGSALTKQLDVAWAVGTNAGGRMSAAAIANTTYHCFAILNDSDNSVDYGFDVSATAPTMPTGYTLFRRVGSILREGATIVAFVQDGDRFERQTPVNDINAANPGTAAVTATMSVPIGINVVGVFWAKLDDATPAAATAMILTDLAMADSAPSINLSQLRYAASGAAVPITASGEVMVRTNTSAQIRYRISASDADRTVNIGTMGWIDTRGRLA